MMFLKSGSVFKYAFEMNLHDSGLPAHLLH